MIKSVRVLLTLLVLAGIPEQSISAQNSFRGIPDCSSDQVLIIRRTQASAGGEQRNYFHSDVDLQNYVSLHPQLASLSIHGDGKALTKIPELPKSLQVLDIENCPNLHSLPSLRSSRLWYLHIKNATGLLSLPAVPNSLQELELLDCGVLVCNTYSIGASPKRILLKNCPGVSNSKAE